MKQSWSGCRRQPVHAGIGNPIKALELIQRAMESYRKAESRESNTRRKPLYLLRSGGISFNLQKIHTIPLLHSQPSTISPRSPMLSHFSIGSLKAPTNFIFLHKGAGVEGVANHYLKCSNTDCTSSKISN